MHVRFVTPQNTWYKYMLLLNADPCTCELLRMHPMALKAGVNGTGAQIVFSSTLSVKGKGLGMSRCILEFNTWLHRWCYQQGFDFIEHGAVFQDEGVVGR